MGTRLLPKRSIFYPLINGERMGRYNEFMSDALQEIDSLFGKSFEAIKLHLQTALASAADPDRSLVYLKRLLESRDESLLQEFIKNPRLIEILVTIFSGSQFLTEIILRNPDNIHLLV